VIYKYFDLSLFPCFESSIILYKSLRTMRRCVLVVKELQWKSLIYESSSTLRAHDLYVEFVQSIVAIKDSQEKKWWVGHKDPNRYNPMLKRLLLLKDVSKICHPPKHLRKCPNLECLIMHDCDVTLKLKLDLKCFANLRLLIITCNGFESEDGSPLPNLAPNFKHDKALNVHGGVLPTLARFEPEIFCGREDENIGSLPELCRVQLCGFNLTGLSFLRHCSNLTFLSVDDCDFDILDFLLDGNSVLKNLKALETLLLSCRLYWGFPRVLFDGILQAAAELKNLMCLEIHLADGDKDEGFCKLDLSPLRCLTSLQTLSLLCLPDSVEELTGLDQLSQLSELNLQWCHGLRKLPNLDLLPNLRRIFVDYCMDLEIPEDHFKRFPKPNSFVRYASRRIVNFYYSNSVYWCLNVCIKILMFKA